ncbi:MAG: hypothetical protein HYV33_06125 [Candidatus Kerfeldbacteria bacterium]|nr:hypothetical protein [Candidatus Kerfeldbacteria bacterium]
MLLRKSALRDYALAIIASAGLFGWLQAIPTFADPDSFYHARLTALMLDHGLLQQLPWLSFTDLAQQFTDQHLLYHLWLLPWVAWFGAAIGAKVGHTILLVVMTLVFVAILRSWKIPYAVPAVLLLYSVSAFLLRINLVKATPLVLILFFGGLTLLLQRRYLAAWCLGMLYPWAHGGFILLPLAAGLMVLADTVAQSWQGRRLKLGDPRPWWIASSAVLVGLVVHPYFPQHLKFYWQQLVQIGVVNYASVISVGAEWYPFSLPNLIGVLSVVLIAVVVAIVVGIFRQPQRLLSTPALTFMGLAIVFTVATLRSRRYVEYLAPVVWFWAMYLALPYLASGQWKADWQRLTHYTGRWYYVFILYCAITIPVGMVRSVLNIHQEFTKGFALDYLAGASRYVQTHAQPGSVVFHSDWDNFPMLFYHNPDNYYIVGLDPTFLYLHNQNTYQQWRQLVDGKVKQSLANTIHQQFGADYVVVDTTDPSAQLFRAYLLRDPELQLVFQDNEAVVFKRSL